MMVNKVLHTRHACASMGIPTYMQYLGAGIVEVLKQGSMNSLHYLRLLQPSMYMSSPYGDANKDYYFNSKGIKRAAAENKINMMTNGVGKYGPYY